MSTATAPVHAQQARIALSALSPFKLNPRKHFGEAALNGLAASIKAQGVVQPILVRPNGGAGKYEIVVGERRWRAAKLAGLTEIPANVRELTDAQALEVAVIENNQREDLHPLEEAEGYEALLKCKHEDGRKYTVDDIVAKIGRSRSYVYQKLKLCELCEEGAQGVLRRQARFLAAILLARIPARSCRKRRSRKSRNGYGGAHDGAPGGRAPAAQLHARARARAVPDQGCQPGTEGRRLQHVPEAQRQLARAFRGCEKWRRVHGSRVLRIEARRADSRGGRQAKAKGLEVITGKDARRIAPHGTSNDLKGYAALDREVYTGNGSWKKLRAILGKDVPKVALLQDADNGALVEVVKSADMAPLLKAKLPKSTRPSGSSDTYANRQREQAQEKAQGRARAAPAHLLRRP
jgi:ParB/RepB/Spo0J family partition protein